MMKEYLRKKIVFQGLPKKVLEFEDSKKDLLEIIFRPKEVTSI